MKNYTGFTINALTRVCRIIIYYTFVEGGGVRKIRHIIINNLCLLNI